MRGGPFTDPGTLIGYTLAYRVLKSELGFTYAFQGSPLMIEAGVLGESYKGKTNAPSDGSNFGPYAGIGIKF